MIANLQNSSLLAEAITHNDKTLMYQMAMAASGEPRVAWNVKPLVDLPVDLTDSFRVVMGAF